jgi:hypothetical protein
MAIASGSEQSRGARPRRMERGRAVEPAARVWGDRRAAPGRECTAPDQGGASIRADGAARREPLFGQAGPSPGDEPQPPIADRREAGGKRRRGRGWG